MFEFDVRITWKDLYDYNLKHSFSSFSGIFGEVIAALGIIIGIQSKYWLLVIVGTVLLLYMPVTLFLRSKQTMLTNEAFKKPFHYVLDENGMSVSQGEDTATIPWENMVKAVSTSRSILLYTSRVSAAIFPKAQLGDSKSALVQTISRYMDPKKVKIRE